MIWYVYTIRTVFHFPDKVISVWGFPIMSIPPLILILLLVWLKFV